MDGRLRQAEAWAGWRWLGRCRCLGTSSSRGCVAALLRCSSGSHPGCGTHPGDSSKVWKHRSLPAPKHPTLTACTAQRRRRRRPHEPGQRIVELHTPIASNRAMSWWSKLFGYGEVLHCHAGHVPLPCMCTTRLRSLDGAICEPPGPTCLQAAKPKAEAPTSPPNEARDAREQYYRQARQQAAAGAHPPLPLGPLAAAPRSSVPSGTRLRPPHLTCTMRLCVHLCSVE